MATKLGLCDDDAWLPAALTQRGTTNEEPGPLHSNHSLADSEVDSRATVLQSRLRKKRRSGEVAQVFGFGLLRKRALTGRRLLKFWEYPGGVSAWRSRVRKQGHPLWVPLLLHAAAPSR